jgi:hypothetical protein
MNDDPLDEPDARLAEGLARLPAEVEPPPRVEDRLVTSLRDRGDIRTARPALPWLIGLSVAAAVVLAFLVLRRAPVPAAEEAQFLLLIAEDTRYAPPTDSAEARARVEEYGAWAGRLAGAGKLVSAGELAPSGTDVHADGNTPSVVDSLAGVVSGYFLIRAESLAQAERMAAESPHLRYGGTVVVRAVLH